MAVRQRKEVLERLCKDFAEYNLPANLTYSGYMTLVADPVLPRAIRKTYGNWSRAVKATQLALAAKKPIAPPVKPELKAQEKEAPVAQEKPIVAPKVVKPSPKPAPAVSKGK